MAEAYIKLPRGADEDACSGRTMVRRREADIRFLAELRTVRTLEHLLRIEEREIRFRAPRWRRVAIERVKQRVTPAPKRSNDKP